MSIEYHSTTLYIPRVYLFGWPLAPSQHEAGITDKVVLFLYLKSYRQIEKKTNRLKLE